MPTEEHSENPEPIIQPVEITESKPETNPVPEPAPSEAPPAIEPAEVVESAPPAVPAAERKTLAQQFSTFPIGAKVGIVVALALLLTIAVLVTFPPSNDQPEVELATETAVAGILTLTAQPTPTPIGTETPRIYIIEESPPPSLTPDVPATPIVYTVRQGDTVNNIARLFNVTVQDIATANGLINVNPIAVGQELIIPTPGAGTAVPAVAPGASTTPVVATNNSAPIAPLPEIVIKGASGAQTVELRIAAGPDYQAITTLNRGALASLVAKTPDGLWYLIQLEDGYTRGWVPANSVGLIYPAEPAGIPTTPQP